MQSKNYRFYVRYRLTFHSAYWEALLQESLLAVTVCPFTLFRPQGISSPIWNRKKMQSSKPSPSPLEGFADCKPRSRRLWKQYIISNFSFYPITKNKNENDGSRCNQFYFAKLSFLLSSGGSYFWLAQLIAVFAGDTTGNAEVALSVHLESSFPIAVVNENCLGAEQSCPKIVSRLYVVI